MNKKNFNPAQIIYIETALEIIELEKFALDVNCDEDGYRFFELTDQQGANLGDIESELFETLGQVIDRLDNYHYDYFDPSHPDNEGYENFYWDFLQNADAADFLCKFTADDYHEYLEDICKLDVKKIKERGREKDMSR